MASEDTASSSSTFKGFKANRGAKVFRKKVKEDEDKDQAETEDDLRVRLEELKEVQKLRAKGRGIVSETTAPKFIGEDEAEDKTTVAIKLDSTFTAQQDIKDIDPLLEKYIREHMVSGQSAPIEATEKVPAKETEDTNEEEDAQAALMKARKELYETPEHLRAESSLLKKADSTNWLTGIMEVPLPIEFKIRNIEETEAAKQNMKTGPGMPKAMLPKKFGKSHSKRKDGEPGPSKEARATDDLVLSNFKKRFRH